jgi:type IX secretion system PorP/SprF family membrane protein
MKQNLLRVLFLILMSAASVQAQDIHFSQFYMSPLNLNPALTGVMNCTHRVSANYRNQWSSVLKSNAYNTYSVSYDRKLTVGRNDYFGLGGTFWGDKAGASEFATLQGRLSGSYSKKMGGGRKKANYLVVGADVGASQRSINSANLQWPSQNNGGVFDPTAGNPEAIANPNFLFMDLAAGVLWFFVNEKKKSNFYIGGAFSHLNRANQSFDEQNIPLFSKLTAHIGGEKMFNPRFGIVPGIVTFFQGPSWQVNGGTSLKFILGDNRNSTQAFQIGAWARAANRLEQGKLLDAIILSTRFDYEQFTIGFSYDVNTSSLSAASNGNGSFEFSMLYKICGQERRGVYCPDF